MKRNAGKETKRAVVMEFHVARRARDRYQFSDALFSLSGNVIFADLHAARVFAKKMNDARDLVRFPEQTVRAGQLNAMGLIDEILHYVFGLYREQAKTDLLGQALAFVQKRCGVDSVDKALRQFLDEFPPVAVYKGALAAEQYLADNSAGVPHRHLVLEEMLMLWLANVNPAFKPFGELFDDASMREHTAYQEILAGFDEFFRSQAKFGPENQDLVAMLRSPALAVPHSLTGQLAYILEKWGHLLGKYFYRLLVGQDLIKEEEKGAFPGGDKGPVAVYEFWGQELEPERFSQDREWMPRLVLMAKNIYVWLDQLSKKYQRPIHKLDHVPDEELDRLAGWGYSGLWLIGLWERSQASRKIKQMCGNPEAVASAYSLYDYFIANDLGGQPAYDNLKDRAWRRGIRLASDMVPNHMGIDSRWLIEHPDWFIALDHCPFPSYTFNGPDLSSDGRVGIFLEDHYYTRSDAAVVFKRLDRQTGSVKYVYHGNDGTSMPWNDTAQLDFLNPATREAVIQTILEVARKSSVIRFDAAMTLAKKHIKRLWFPEPGGGGAIPSRSEHGMSREQFDAAIPQEFWREVVDRVAREVPDTLLLAEAFWMMEGYFVRTLGMHRVYNSAFMNMLKNEDNGKYRSVMRNTLEFNPEILKRFVNFMNNPDEDTAVAQFGKDDKYFGVCTLMATLPGLPMFGHGQLEGFTEKYGMEYRRAYHDEHIDEHLLARHEREIFPLLRKRYLFAEVENFYLFDVVTPQGHVNEDVFAYANRAGDERALVVYHNKYASMRGWIRTSVGYAGRTGKGEERRLMRKNLGAALGLHPDGDHYTIFRDHVTGLSFIRANHELCTQGLFVDLHAFHFHVFLDFHQVRDNGSRQYAQLAGYLNGRGVPNMDEALREVFLRPVLDPFKELVNAPLLRQFADARVTDPHGFLNQDLLDAIEHKTVRLLEAVQRFGGGRAGTESALAKAIRRQLETVSQLPVLQTWHDWPAAPACREAIHYVLANLKEEPRFWACLYCWVVVHSLGAIVDADDAAQISRSWLDEWLLGRVIANALRELGLDGTTADRSEKLVALLTTQQRWWAAAGPDRERAGAALEALLKDAEGQQLLNVNRYEDVVWFTGEALDEMLAWLFLIAVVQDSADPDRPAAALADDMASQHRVVRILLAAGAQAEHRVEKLLEATRRAVSRDALAERGTKPPTALR